MSRRSWIIGVSIVTHLALGAGVFISGIWQIERLDPEKPSLGAIGMLSIPEPAGSPPAAAPKVALAEKAKVKVKTLAQVDKPDPTPAKASTETTSSGSGSGSGAGSGSGEGSGSGSGSGGCLVPGQCQVAKVDPPKPVDPPKLPTLVPPTTLQTLWLSGDRKVHPTDITKREMLQDGRKKSVGVVKACVGEGGNVTSAVLVSSTKYGDYDARLLAAVRGWRYRPYLVGGKAVAVCGMVTFIYSIE